jgi:hypothetical protein
MRSAFSDFAYPVLSFGRCQRQEYRSCELLYPNRSAIKQQPYDGSDQSSVTTKKPDHCANDHKRGPKLQDRGLVASDCKSQFAQKIAPYSHYYCSSSLNGLRSGRQAGSTDISHLPGSWSCDLASCRPLLSSTQLGLAIFNSLSQH